MSEAKHTPGPWAKEHGRLYDSRGEPILMNGVSLPSGNHPKDAEADANRDLFFAAPELLEALEDFARDVWCDCRLPSAMRRDLQAMYFNQVLPIIAKAKGGSA